MPAFVYILKCVDGTLYTGWTKDLDKRIKEHNFGKNGAKYTRARRPVKMVYSEKMSTSSAARKKEAQIKKLSRKEKLVLIKNYKAPKSRV